MTVAPFSTTGGYGDVPGTATDGPAPISDSSLPVSITTSLRRTRAGPPHIAELPHDDSVEMVIRSRVLSDRGTGQVEEIGASYIPVEIAGGTFL